MPGHSLITQSLHATEGRSETNGDGFGLGWYGERENSGLYREITLACLTRTSCRSMPRCARECFLAHVRAATGTATSRANCHPFSVGRYLFMHNGQIGGSYNQTTPEGPDPDKLYNDRIGTTDTEALFLIALRNVGAGPGPGHGQDHGPGSERNGSCRRQRAVAPHRRTDRWPKDLGVSLASHMEPATLYHRRSETNTIVVSEPIDEQREDWLEVPPNHVLVARHGTLALYCRSIPRGRPDPALRRGAVGYSQSRPCVDGSRTRTRTSIDLELK